MSTNRAARPAEEELSAALRSALSGDAAVPRLNPLRYREWKRKMAAFLNNKGFKAQVYTQAVHAFAELKATVESWCTEESTALGKWKSVMKAPASSSSTSSAAAASSSSSYASVAISGTPIKIKKEVTPPTQVKDDDFEYEDKKALKQVLKDNKDVYGYIYRALPDEVKKYTYDLTQDYAYELWHYLEKKYQNTEDDTITLLFGELFSCRMMDTESYEQYKLRVDDIVEQLEHGECAVPAKQYRYLLLDRLLSHFNTFVDVLKQTGKVSDASKINWLELTQQFSTHERMLKHKANEAAAAEPGAIMSFKKVTSSQSSSSGAKPSRNAEGLMVTKRGIPVKCFCCQANHFRNKCRCSKCEQEQVNGFGSTNNNENAHAVTTNRSSNDGWAPLNDEFLGSCRVSVAEMTGLDSQINIEEESNALLNQFDHVLRVPRFYDDDLADAISDSVSLNDSVKNSVEITMAAVRAAQANIPPPSAPLPNNSGIYTIGIDTMASVHITGRRELLVRVEKVSPITAKVADGTAIQIEFRGTLRVRVKPLNQQPVWISINEVYYNPRFTETLISWGTLKKLDVGWKHEDGGKEEFIITPKGRKLKLNTTRNIWLLPCSAEEIVMALSTVNSSNTPITSASQLVLLHERLGHVHYNRLMTLINSKAILGLGKWSLSSAEVKIAEKAIRECHACTIAKGTHLPLGHKGLHRSTDSFAILHFDSWVMSYIDRHGNRVHDYGILIKDSATDWLITDLFKQKDLIPPRIKQILISLRNKLNGNIVIKELHGDNGTELFTELVRAYCRENGIEITCSPPHQPALNGIAERAVRIIKEGVSVLLIQCGLPEWMWGHALRHYCYVWNRMRVSVHQGTQQYRSAYTLVYGRVPDLTYVRKFGCDVYIFIPKEKRESSMAHKMQLGIYLGHDEQKSCALVYRMKDGAIIHTRDIRAREDQFTCAKSLNSGSQINTEIIDTDTEFSEAELSSSNQVNVTSSQSPTIVQSSPGGPQALVSVKSNTEYSVEKVVGRKIENDQLMYRVRWNGFQSKDDTWEPYTNLQNARQAVDEYDGAQRESRQSECVRQLKADFDSVATDNGAQSDDDSTHADNQAETVNAVIMQCESSPREYTLLQKLQREAERAISLESMNADEIQRDNQLISTYCAYAVRAAIDLIENDKKTPTTYGEAMQSHEKQKWLDAMSAEWHGINERGTFKFIKRTELPKNANILPCKWVYKIKVDENGNVSKYKARLTPKGFRQKAGVDYNEVYANTGMYKTLRLQLALTAAMDMELEQLDVEQAFLYADLDEEVYMEVPLGYKDKYPGMVIRLLKALYGLKQAPRNWQLLLTSILMERIKLNRSYADPSLYWKISRTGNLILIYVFVDDMQGSYRKEDQKEWDEIKQLLSATLKIADMGESKWILGMRVRRDRVKHTITLDQELYVTKTLQHYGLEQCSVSDSPEAVGADKITTNSGLFNRLKFMEIVGKLLYAALSTRPDITHAVQSLAKHGHEPLERHWFAAQRVLRYLAGTRDQALVFGGKNTMMSKQVHVVGYGDADHGNDRTDCKSVTGYLIRVNGDIVIWGTKKQSVVATSTCEAEVHAATYTCKEMIWCRDLLIELKVLAPGRSTLYCDNRPATNAVEKGVKTKRIKHLDIECKFLIDHLSLKRTIKIEWIATDQQQADIFTKAMPREQFSSLKKLLFSQ